MARRDSMTSPDDILDRFRADAGDAERERCAAICDLCLVAGFPELMAPLILEADLAAEDARARLQMLAAGRAVGRRDDDAFTASLNLLPVTAATAN